MDPADELKDLSNAKQIAIDLETRDPNLTTIGSGSVRKDGEIVGIAVAVDGWSGYYPIAHEGGGNIDKKITMDWFKDVLQLLLQRYFTMQCTMYLGYDRKVCLLTDVSSIL